MALGGGGGDCLNSIFLHLSDLGHTLTLKASTKCFFFLFRPFLNFLVLLGTGLGWQTAG